MLKHCTIWEEWISGKNNYTHKQAFMGILPGKIALKSMIKDDGPLKRNISGAQFYSKKWIAPVEDYAQLSNPNFVHDFFGKMTK